MSEAEEVGLDIAEAKRMLASATRPAVKELLGSFVREATARELKLLTSTPSVAPPAMAMEDEAEPKAAPGVDDEGADLLEPAPLKQRDANSMEVDSSITAPPPTKLRPSSHVQLAPELEWVEPGYGWEQGEYNTPWVNVMVSIDGVGAARDRVTCDFGQDSFDLRIVGAAGQNYRLFVEALDKDIIPGESKVVVKKNRVTVKLRKVKGEYSYDNWTELKKKGGKAAKEKEKSRDPSAGIMDLMKDLYDNGDDNMRKIIGESMMKSRKGERVDPGDISKDMDPGNDFTGGLQGGKMPDLGVHFPDEPEELQ
ncbi:hypothetical protein CTAYLR_002447 [Chrysophaeum taylorii]|uniref:Calcyclin-binding protein n=1 Tax=Chrysophaeum taylorii TaxID=2483200 RepID=A0AAD7XR00_9STRA|nr:hypothetical protein CTAYLR_002447 [Chrysophaeum taylorii]